MPTPDNNDRVECVGSLLVHTSDMKEFGELTHTDVPHIMPNVNVSHDVECVGSLLVATNDVKELSDVKAPTASPTIKRRVTVGTLLVNTDDLDMHRDDNKGK